MSYHQLTSGERYALSALKKQGFSQAAIARALGRNPGTISRELKRNVRQKDWYRPSEADQMTRGRRSRSRRNQRFTSSEWALVDARLALLWSPEQIAGRLGADRLLSISHETIYRHVWENWKQGGSLYQHLRGARKQKRKRYRSSDQGSASDRGSDRHVQPAKHNPIFVRRGRTENLQI